MSLAIIELFLACAIFMGWSLSPQLVSSNKLSKATFFYRLWFLSSTFIRRQRSFSDVFCVADIRFLFVLTSGVGNDAVHQSHESICSTRVAWWVTLPSETLQLRLTKCFAFTRWHFCLALAEYRSTGTRYTRQLKSALVWLAVFSHGVFLLPTLCNLSTG